MMLLCVTVPFTSGRARAGCAGHGHVGLRRRLSRCRVRQRVVGGLDEAVAGHVCVGRAAVATAVQVQVRRAGHRARTAALPPLRAREASERKVSVPSPLARVLVRLDVHVLHAFCAWCVGVSCPASIGAWRCWTSRRWKWRTPCPATCAFSATTSLRTSSRSDWRCVRVDDETLSRMLRRRRVCVVCVVVRAGWLVRMPSSLARAVTLPASPSSWTT